MDITLKEIKMARYKVLLQRSLTTAETEQWWDAKQQERLQSRVRAIESNKSHIVELQREIEEIKAGRHDTLIAVYQQMGEPASRETMIEEAQDTIEWCERNLQWFAEKTPVVAGASQGVIVMPAADRRGEHHDRDRASSEPTNESKRDRQTGEPQRGTAVEGEHHDRERALVCMFTRAGFRRAPALYQK